MNAIHKNILSLQNFSASYGRMPVISNISFTVSAGEIVTLIGPNGAGKSTVLKAIAGLITADGKLELVGKLLNGLNPAERMALGISYCPQDNRVFSELSVYENLEVAGHTLSPSGLSLAIERSLSAFPILKPLVHRPAGVLSGGEQQILALARALIPEPQLLMLDEPTAGLTPSLTTEILEMIRGIAASGIAILVVEQKVKDALQVSDSVICLKSGHLVFSGSAAELLSDEPRLASLFF